MMEKPKDVMLLVSSSLTECAISSLVCARAPAPHSLPAPRSAAHRAHLTRAVQHGEQRQVSKTLAQQSHIAPVTNCFTCITCTGMQGCEHARLMLQSRFWRDQRARAAHREHVVQQDLRHGCAHHVKHVCSMCTS